MQLPDAVSLPQAIMYIGIGLGLAGAGIGIALKIVSAKSNGRKSDVHPVHNNTDLLVVYDKLDEIKRDLIEEIRREVDGGMDKLSDVLTLGLSKIEGSLRGRRGKS